MKKVLIIEDDLFYRKIYKRKFEVAGFGVEVAEDGVVGLEKMRSFQPDIVFIDLMMPRMDGFQFLDKVKADGALAATPIVVLTNLSTAGDADKALQKGAAWLLVKSDTEPDLVIEKANHILAQAGKSKPATDTSAS